MTYNERQLNNGQQGTGSGLDADKLDGTEKSGLGGMTDEEQNNLFGIINDVAENRVANNLSPETYENLFFDTFIDLLKIDSSSNVTITTGQSGNIKLASADGPTVSRETDDSTKQSSNGGGIVINPNTDLESIKGEISSNASGYGDVYIEDDSGTVLDSTTPSGGSFELNASLSAGNDYDVYLNDGGDVFTWGQDTDPSFPYTSDDMDIVAGWDGGVHIQSEAINIKSITPVSANEQSGTVTSTSKTVSSPSDTVQIYQQAQLNSQDIQYVVSDGAGNSKTITQSDVGESVSVNFTGTDMTVELQFNGDGTDTPVLEEYGVDF